MARTTARPTKRSDTDRDAGFVAVIPSLLALPTRPAASPQINTYIGASGSSSSARSCWRSDRWLLTLGAESALIGVIGTAIGSITGGLILRWMTQ